VITEQPIALCTRICHNSVNGNVQNIGETFNVHNNGDGDVNVRNDVKRSRKCLVL
jgi:hypothetical protein